MEKLTSAEISIYYDKINELVDKYIVDWHVSPSKLSNYLKKGNARFEKLVKKSGLSDFKFINKVVTDIIEDRVAMEFDGLMNESILNNINQVNVEYEKILADMYNTSIGHVVLIDDNSHLYKVTDFNDVVNVIIYSSDDLLKVKKNIETKYITDISAKEISVDDLDIVLKLSDIISDNKILDRLDKNLNSDNIINHITKNIKSDKAISRLKYKTFKTYCLWEITYI